MKRIASWAGIAATGMLLYSAGYVTAKQSNSTEAKREAYLKEYIQSRADVLIHGMQINLDLRSGKKPGEIKTSPDVGVKYIDNLAKGVNDSDLAHTVMASDIVSYYEMKASSESAPQATQAASKAILQLEVMQTAQNQKMIELLKQIAAKK